MPSHPKPAPRKIPAVKIESDDREICNLKVKAGRDEYRRRRDAMYERQNGRCGLCGLWVHPLVATFEHVAGRGSGGSRRDDRIEIDGRPYNMMTCFMCNSRKGSKRLPSR
jgi:hypothetical protein